MTYSYYLF